MTDRRDEIEGEPRQTGDIAPELHNSEQEDEQLQAQTVTDEALRGGATFGLGDTEKVSTGDDSDDVQDIVDHMHQMVTSGRIDSSAFAGEPNHDDEDAPFPAGDDGDDLDGLTAEEE